MNEKKLIGKKIKEIEVDGYGIYIVFEDDTVFDYTASDGGYSCWSIIQRRKNNNR